MILSYNTIVGMGRHERTLAAVFDQPTRGSIRWKDIESLLKHKGAEITEGQGSRVRVALNGIRAVFHRPHPTPHTNKGAVESVRAFLERAGIKPETD
jgi:HicA toxin of bacterial toxin-antitoxin,